MLDHAERRDRIARELELHARRLGGRVQLKEHAALIDEVADLVEYPGVVAGFFDRAFLELPHEVLTTTLVHHQHYFPVVTESGELKEAFLAVVNTQPADERVIAKNAERVVTARLRDAKFFWDADRKTTLESRLDRLHTVLFHKKLGKLPRQGRTHRDAGRLDRARGVGRPAEAAHAAQAARLAKTDLTTDMVFEFPELQGTMGGIYAREEGQPEQVWKAIYYQYLPVGVEADAPPTRAQLGAAAVTWAAVSLADKLDTFVSLSRAGEKATGSRDPFGLRRQMQGAVRILMDLPELTGIDREVSLARLTRAAPLRGHDAAVDRRGAQAALTFAIERVRYALEQRGFAGEVVRAATLRGRRQPAARAPRGRSAQGMRGVGGLPGAGGPLQARQEHRQGAARRRHAARPRGARRAGRAGAARGLDLRRPRDRQAAVAAATTAPHSPRSPASARPSTGSSPSVRHGGRRAGEARAADAHGGLRDLILAPRRHFGNHSSNGVVQSMAKKLARKSRRSEDGQEPEAPKAEASSAKAPASTSTSSAARPTATDR